MPLVAGLYSPAAAVGARERCCHRFSRFDRTHHFSGALSLPPEPPELQHQGAGAATAVASCKASSTAAGAAILQPSVLSPFRLNWLVVHALVSYSQMPALQDLEAVLRSGQSLATEQPSTQLPAWQKPAGQQGRGEAGPGMALRQARLWKAALDRHRLAAKHWTA